MTKQAIQVAHPELVGGGVTSLHSHSGGGGAPSPMPTYSWNSGGIAITAINTLLMDLFNASGSGKVVKIFQIEAYQRNTASVTGVSICLEAFRTTDVGTGGSVRTADKMDTADPNIPAEITCRTSPTGGATPTGAPIAVGNIYTEEGANNQSQLPMYENPGTGVRTRLTLREGEGIRIVSGPWGTAGTITLRIAAEVS